MKAQLNLGLAFWPLLYIYCMLNSEAVLIIIFDEFYKMLGFSNAYFYDT